MKTNEQNIYKKLLKEEINKLDQLILSISNNSGDKSTGSVENINLLKEICSRINSLSEKLDNESSYDTEFFKSRNDIVVKKNKFLNEILEKADVGSWEWNAKTNTIFCSNTTLRILGLPKDKSIVTPDEMFKNINSEDQFSLKSMLKRAYKDHQDFKIFQRLEKKFSKTRFVEIRGSVSGGRSKDSKKMVGSVQDITELRITKEKLFLANQELETKVSERTRDLKRAYINLERVMIMKDKLLEKERQLATIVESSSAAIISISLQGIIKSWNKGAQGIFGYKEREMIGEHISSIFQENEKNEIDLLVDRAQNRLMKFFSNNKNQSGQTINIGLTFSPIKNHLGDAIGISIFGKDRTSQVLNEQILKETELKYTNLIKTMNEGVLIVDNNDVITFVNDYLCKMLHYETHELIGKKVGAKLLDKEEKNSLSKVISSREKGLSYQYEIRLKKKSKQKLWMLVSESPTKNVEGMITGRVGLYTNITGRKYMEQELNSIANIPKENPNPTFRYSIHGQVLLYSNPASNSLLEFFDDEKNAEAKNNWIKIINQTYRKGKPVEKELKINEKTYMCTIVPVPENKYINIYADDITAMKKAEAEIKRLSIVLAKTDNAVVIADKKGNIKWVNEGFTRVTGYSFEEVEGTNGERLRKGEQTGLNINHPFFKKMLAIKKSFSYESLNYKKNGEEYWSITTLTPVFDELGELESIIAIDTDITYKKSVERELRKAKQIAEDTAKTKEQFLANVSHEIRTPMNAIMGIIQLLRGTEVDEKQNEYLKSMDFAGENLLRIINDVLDFSKMESGKLSIEKIPFNVVDVINDLFKSMSHLADDKGISFIKKVDKNIPKLIVGDPVRLNQVLINIISNAIKFTNIGFVKLTVGVKNRTETGLKLRVIIQDTGIGVPKELHKIIFCDFEQANKETTRIYGGTGLGLSIVKRLLELQNGTIKINSEVGKGSKFIFEIPYQVANATLINMEKVVDEVPKDDLLNKKILLVEDNALNQMVARNFLENMGAKVTVTNDGEEGVQALTDENFDIVLMDIQMPKMDGYSAARYIRNEMSGIKRKIPILAMTAHAISGEREKCLNAGMTDYITKPLKKELLQNKIIELLKNN